MDPSCRSSALPHSLGHDFFNFFIFFLIEVNGWSDYDLALHVIRILMAELQVTHMNYYVNFHPCGQRHSIGCILHLFKHFYWSFVFSHEALVFASPKLNLFRSQFDEDPISHPKLKGVTFLICPLLHLLRGFL